MVKCEKCGQENEGMHYFGFMLLGEEYEFEDVSRCESCTEKARFEQWNKIVMELDVTNPCEICPFESEYSCIIYWDATEEEMFGKLKA